MSGFTQLMNTYIQHSIEDVIMVRIPPYRDRPFRLNVTVCSG